MPRKAGQMQLSEVDNLMSSLELRQSTVALSVQQLAARNRDLDATVGEYARFYDRSPIAFVSFDFLARIVKVNRAASILLRVDPDECKGRLFNTFVTEETCAGFLEHLRRCRRSNRQPVTTEIEVVPTDGERIPIQLISSRSSIEGKETFETALLNIHDQRAANVALQRALEYADAIVSTIPYPVLVLDTRGHIITANRAFYTTFQTHAGNVITWNFSQLPDVHWQSPGLEKLMLDVVARGGGDLHETQIRARIRNDFLIVLQLHARRLRAANQAEPMLLLAFEDITRRKRIEEERECMLAELEEARPRLEARVEERTVQLAQSLGQLREVSEQLVLAHESEQRRIARELHDQVGQDLTALRLMFNRSAKDESNPQRQTFADAERVVEEAIQNIRNICSTLRPQVLDDLGLLAGLEWHIKTFGARSNLKIDFEHNGVDETRLSPILKSAIFRVIQEALTNIARHAATNRATVVLWMTEHDVIFRIQDRGKGFNPNGDLKGHNGISSMRERVSLVNGQYDLKSRPGRGCTIQVQIPLTIHNNGKSNRS